MKWCVSIAPIKCDVHIRRTVLCNQSNPSTIACSCQEAHVRTSSAAASRSSHLAAGHFNWLGTYSSPSQLSARGHRSVVSALIWLQQQQNKYILTSLLLTRSLAHSKMSMFFIALFVCFFFVCPLFFCPLQQLKGWRERDEWVPCAQSKMSSD